MNLSEWAADFETVRAAYGEAKDQVATLVEALDADHRRNLGPGHYIDGDITPSGCAVCALLEKYGPETEPKFMGPPEPGP